MARNAACSGAAPPGRGVPSSGATPPRADAVTAGGGQPPAVFSRVEGPQGPYFIEERRNQSGGGGSGHLPGVGRVPSGVPGLKHGFLWPGPRGWLCCPVGSVQEKSLP